MMTDYRICYKKVQTYDCNDISRLQKRRSQVDTEDVYIQYTQKHDTLLHACDVTISIVVFIFRSFVKYMGPSIMRTAKMRI